MGKQGSYATTGEAPGLCTCCSHHLDHSPPDPRKAPSFTSLGLQTNSQVRPFLTQNSNPHIPAPEGKDCSVLDHFPAPRTAQQVPGLGKHLHEATGLAQGHTHQDLKLPPHYPLSQGPSLLLHHTPGSRAHLAEPQSGRVEASAWSSPYPGLEPSSREASVRLVDMPAWLQ